MQSKSFFKRWSQPVLVTGAAALLVCTSAMADDTEVYQAQIDASAPPNLMLSLDYSGSMGDPIIRGSGDPPKIDILKAAVRTVLVNNAGSVNLGLGLYSLEPTGVTWPISDLTADANTIDPAIPEGTKTVADIISALLDARDTGGGTATVDAITEAAAYFRGDPVYHNGAPASNLSAHRPNTYNPATGTYRGGHPNAAVAASYSPTNAYQPTGWRGADYVSPINAECGVNAIVLVSDGRPTKRLNKSQTGAILGHNESQCEDLLTTTFPNGGLGQRIQSADAGRCGPELARQLANQPQVPGITDSTVRTYTVGFAADALGGSYLERLAAEGNGTYFDASTPHDLSDALDQILQEIQITSQSFVPLAVDVDRANFSHDNRLYFSMFKPSASASWKGNLKGYFFGQNGLLDINDADATELVNGVRVMRTNAQSFWSRSPDGDEVTSGGASELLANGNRLLLTYTGGPNLPTIGVPLATSGDHDLVPGNAKVTDAMLGGTGNRDDLLTQLQTAPMGDPLHSQPTLVNYGDQRVMYVMTNQGFLHAIDATTPVTANGDDSGGEEIFAFMPPELLANVPDHFSGVIKPQRTYGLDGALVRWHDDNNDDGIVNGTDTVMLVFGMRRGGASYYAVDVTRPDSPRFMWQIDGGSNDFPHLGETWSRPSLVTVMKNGIETEVLAFGGGYDAANLDGTTNNVKVNSGNAIYMVDNEGNKVWSVDGSTVGGMDYAIPSDLTIIDTDGDDVVDRIYVGDLGGNIWRVDIDDVSNGTSAEILATLNDFGDQSFFYPPTVALNNSTVLGDFISVAIGSGNRTNPLRLNSGNHIFMIRDTNVTDPLPNNFNTINASDLHDATLNPLGDANSVTAANALADLNASEGWYIQLGDHEKVLSPLVTFEGRLFGTTFDVDQNSLIDPCEPPGENRFYMMDLATSKPLESTNTDGTIGNLTPGDRSQRVNGDGILPQPTIMFPPDGEEVAIIVDNEVVSTFSQDFTRIFWHNK